ncbi:hypothetical protein [Candidatus Neoehrlichia procyonis]|uniref:Uncharacterized protein n=1 Tax=Candidatus Neoehrlichia procyonis str. RAC413 TaxID=1359163 RepID=A0A0F3NLF1_9RICK|nr:hypothetical protein [Candidatus Neoehrlichia lotoris]KJV68893.1 hypothetical protein NLO413_0263 [Candidatus Neoehrlichia lotoris str. RAC413]
MYILDNEPILMLWMVKDPTLLQNDQLPLPNNDKYPYKQRLLNWADSEPQRTIKLYYVSTGLKQGHVKALHALTDIKQGGRNNIAVIDLNAKFSQKYDLQYLNNQKIPFAWKIDMLRLIMLLEDAPSLYCDFDITPLNNKRLEIEIGSLGYSMLRITNSRLENSVIAVAHTHNMVASTIYNIMMRYYILKFEKLKNNLRYNVNLVYTLSEATMVFILDNINTKLPIDKVFDIKELQKKLKGFLHCYGSSVVTLKSQLKVDNYSQCFGLHAKECNLNIGSDNSWHTQNQPYLYINSPPPSNVEVQDLQAQCRFGSQIS